MAFQLFNCAIVVHRTSNLYWFRERERDGRPKLEERSWAVHSHGLSRICNCGDKYVIQSSYFKRFRLFCFHCLFLYYRHSCSAPSSLHFSQVYYLFFLFFFINFTSFFFNIWKWCTSGLFEICRSEHPDFTMPVFYRIVIVALFGYENLSLKSMIIWFRGLILYLSCAKLLCYVTQDFKQSMCI